ncbi:unnamed protein product [Vitrella brassicaformis CCMP3155]|uniref:Beta-lactamase-related domain-containing protein n=1 Tax=Vitrella brassicaformis (strain CCMP3155) TaxID=1169540 RepID=A0A0G4H442_VITBC|nr:unnamed protein product [Vitrella brassicaformis CCMP3155]|eukprot:CEM38519.1 unnamed protein product [Vitrella brassicaformis CCMP3155]
MSPSQSLLLLLAAASLGLASCSNARLRRRLELREIEEPQSVFPLIENRTDLDVQGALQEALDLQVGFNGDYGSGILRVESLDPSAGVVFEGAAGRRTNNSDPSDTPTTPDMQFEIASIGKMFTAVVMMQLVDEGKVSLDDPITEYLVLGNISEVGVVGDDPSVGEGGGFVIPESLHRIGNTTYTANITVRMTLDHRSGVQNYWDLDTFLGDYEREADRYWLGAETLIYPAEVEAHFPPGTPGRYEYTDTAFMLAGLIIEKVEGKPLSQSYSERIFGPVGMNNTYSQYREDNPNPDGEVARYAIEGGLGLIDMRATPRNTAEWAGGAMASDASDLCAFLKALFSGRLMSPESLEAMTNFEPTDEEGVSYGLGINKRVYGAGSIIGHSGYGRSFAYGIPEYGLVMAGTLNNHENSDHLFQSSVLEVLNKYYATTEP